MWPMGSAAALFIPVSFRPEEAACRLQSPSAQEEVAYTEPAQAAGNHEASPSAPCQVPRPVKTHVRDNSLPLM